MFTVAVPILPKSAQAHGGPWATYQGYCRVAIQIHPVEHHQGEEVADMQRRSRGVDSDINTDALPDEDVVESFSAAGGRQQRPTRLVLQRTQRCP